MKNKEYYRKNKDKIMAQHKKYYKAHRDEILAHRKQYYKEHGDAQLASMRKYYKEHRDEMSAYNKLYYEQNKDRYRQWAKVWRESHREQRREIERRHGFKRRSLGFVCLNKPFEGSEAHHICPTFVIYIPKDIHQSISHNVWTGKNMDEINRLAWEWVKHEGEK